MPILLRPSNLARLFACAIGYLANMGCAWYADTNSEQYASEIAMRHW
jgi:hypothetical protein